jgi:hypothetical protein
MMLMLRSFRRKLCVSRALYSPLKEKQHYSNKLSNIEERKVLRRVEALAFDGKLNKAFCVHQSWLESRKHLVESGDAECRSMHRHLVRFLVFAVDKRLRRITLKRFLGREKNDVNVEIDEHFHSTLKNDVNVEIDEHVGHVRLKNDEIDEHWVHSKLDEIERIVSEYDVVLPWRSYRHLSSLEVTLCRWRQGLDGSCLAQRVERPRVQLGERELAVLDSLVARVNRLQNELLGVHGRVPADLAREDDALCVEMMYLAQVKGHGLRAVLQCYTLRLAQIDCASDKLNSTLLRLAKTAISEAIGMWYASDKPATLRAKMPAALVDDVLQVLALVPAMRDLRTATLACAFDIAYTLDEPSAFAIVLDALEHSARAIDKRLATIALNVCLRFAPHNALRTVDLLWHLFRTSPKLKPTPAILGMSMNLYRTAGDIDKLINCYEQAIDEFGVQVDERNVATLMHGVVDRRHATPSVEHQLRALDLAEQSGYVRSPSVQWRILDIQPIAWKKRFARQDQETTAHQRLAEDDFLAKLKNA